jgi:septum formation topological specificity factor MinE
MPNDYQYRENLRDDIAAILDRSSLVDKWAVDVVLGEGNTIDIAEYDGELRARLTIEFY